MSVKFVRLSSNRKIGTVSATYASQASCPSTCPFYNNGCYAEHGPLGIHAKRLNQSQDTAVQVAEREAELILNAANDPLQPSIPLRLHAVGDCATVEAAEIVARAAEVYIDLKGPVWTYTHAWRDVPREAWGRVSVLASCETVADVKEASRRGYATAIVREQERTERLEGMTFVPCPQQTSGRTCADCRMCFQDNKLHQVGTVVVFEPHGARRKTISDTVNLLELARAR